MFSVKQSLIAATTSVMLMTGSIAFQASALAAPAVFDNNSLVLNIPEVDLHAGETVSTWNAQLKLVLGLTPITLDLIAANPVASAKSSDRAIFFDDTAHVHLPDVKVNGQSFYAKLKLVPGSNPLRFQVEQLSTHAFAGCPSFASPGIINGSCVLSGEYNQDITLTKNIIWLLSGAVYIGGDNTNSATLTIEPGTEIVGQRGADFLWVRRGSKINAEGIPNDPILMTGSARQGTGEWGGLLIAGNAPVNGCAEGVELCELAFEAIATERFGGNNANDNSGLLKYTQVNNAGFAVRADEELNGVTLLGVGAGTTVDYLQVDLGLDDGVEMFGGTVQMKHVVLSNIGDDSLDWGFGWRGKAQFVLIKQAENDADRGIEADNNPNNNDDSPRSKPILSNITALGSPAGSQGALLRVGTGANIYNSVFTGFGGQCLRIDNTPTYNNAGTPDNLTGELTIENSYVNCSTNFKDEADEPFLVSDWFTAQNGNVEGDPQLQGYLPAAGSPLINGGSSVADPFFTTVDYIGAFKDSAHDWTDEWTTGL